MGIKIFDVFGGVQSHELGSGAILRNGPWSGQTTPATFNEGDILTMTEGTDERRYRCVSVGRQPTGNRHERRAAMAKRGRA